MPEKITYYAVTDVDYNSQDEGLPDLQSQDVIGVARRRFLDNGGFVDEEFWRRDLTWGLTTVIIEWEHGESPDVIEITSEQANRLVERFRAESAG
jgi:hypothetical protein